MFSPFVWCSNTLAELFYTFAMVNHRCSVPMPNAFLGYMIGWCVSCFLFFFCVAYLLPVGTLVPSRALRFSRHYASFLSHAYAIKSILMQSIYLKFSKDKSCFVVVFLLLSIFCLTTIKWCIKAFCCFNYAINFHTDTEIFCHCL